MMKSYELVGRMVWGVQDLGPSGLPAGAQFLDGRRAACGLRFAIGGPSEFRRDLGMPPVMTYVFVSIIYIYICMYLYIYIYISLYTYIYICLSVYLSIYLSIYLLLHSHEFYKMFLHYGDVYVYLYKVTWSLSISRIYTRYGDCCIPLILSIFPQKIFLWRLSKFRRRHWSSSNLSRYPSGPLLSRISLCPLLPFAQQVATF